MRSKLETYRAGTRKVKRREGLISDIYVELPDGLVTPRLTRLGEKDAFVQDSELRMRPTENVYSSRQHDNTWMAMLPPDALELIAASCETSRDVHNLRVQSATAHAQYVPKRILRLLVVVDGWDA